MSPSPGYAFHLVAQDDSQAALCGARPGTASIPAQPLPHPPVRICFECLHVVIAVEGLLRSLPQIETP